MEYNIIEAIQNAFKAIKKNKIIESQSVIPSYTENGVMLNVIYPDGEEGGVSGGGSAEIPYYYLITNVSAYDNPENQTGWKCQVTLPNLSYFVKFGDKTFNMPTDDLVPANLVDELDSEGTSTGEKVYKNYEITDDNACMYLELGYVNNEYQLELKIYNGGFVPTAVAEKKHFILATITSEVNNSKRTITELKNQYPLMIERYTGIY